ncbi:exosome complex component RRP45 [Onthophagus taurus]|uniref:exosome complex component RRP45 n=1 Tax=Onthophagus taurus TaxID=166361 RepID=UPI0039BE25A6
MSKIRETLVSNCEKKFVLKNLSEHKRLDGRAFEEFRAIKIEFGKDWGSCHVTLGETKILAQVSCEIQQPKASRPSEGLLNINLELNPLAAPHFEPNRQSDLSVQLNRLLEKGLKDSKAVDLESLCIKVNEKVWSFRVDINVLNHEGNILDAASVAALSALTHFRRPDVTCEGEEFIVHNFAQRDPIPTVIHHYPICISYGVFNNGEIILADPTLLEENVSQAQLSLSLNAYKELCGVHLGGNAPIGIESIMKTTNSASKRAKEIIDYIKKSIEEDSIKRKSKQHIGFNQTLYNDTNVLPTLANEELTKCLDKWSVNKKKRAKKRRRSNNDDNKYSETTNFEKLGKNAVALIPCDDEKNDWVVSSDEEQETPQVSVKNVKKNKNQRKDEKMELGDSEEENVVILNPTQKKERRKKKY